MTENRNLKKIVVSAINFSEGGPLSILKECLGYLSNNLAKEYEIIALVNNKEVFDYENIKFYSFPKSKKSWLVRLYYEYIYFYGFSKKLKPYLWVSLHDITPNVKADIQVVYCHNPSPFYKLSLKEAYLDGRFALFNFLYRYLYLINIKKNDFIIVQQDYFRKKFIKLIEADKIVVAYPNIKPTIEVNFTPEEENTFFYPALPRVFKNFEVICKASEILIKKGVTNFQVLFTISGNENRYSKYIYKSFNFIKNIKFLGMQNMNSVFKIYNKASCIIFPSKLETWGMPITEAKFFLKPIFLADLAYAYETIGNYDKIKFFNPDDPNQLALLMEEMIDNKIIFQTTEARNINQPFAQNWQQLFDILL